MKYRVGNQTVSIPDGTSPESTRKALDDYSKRLSGNDGNAASTDTSPDGDYQFSGTDAAVATAQGFNVGLIDVATLPLEAARGVLNAISFGVEQVAKAVGHPIDIPEIRSQAEAVKNLVGERFAYQDKADLDPSLRPFATAGEVLGQSLPFAAVPAGAAARAGTAPLIATIERNAIGPKILESARVAPARFAVGEGSFATGSAVAGGASEAIFPGDTGKRVVAEIAGGFLSPLSAVTRAINGFGGKAAGGVQRLIKSQTRGGREQAASRYMQNLMKRFGYDPKEVAKTLTSEGGLAIPGAAPTSAQKSGNTIIAALERKLVADSADLGINIRKQTEETISAARAEIKRLSDGDPQNLRKLAVARDRYFRSLLESRARLAEERARELVDSVRLHSPEARREANIQARNIIEQSRTEARRYESTLWQDVPRDRPADSTLVADAEASVTGDLLPGESLDLPGPIQREVNRILEHQNQQIEGVAEGKAPIEITTGELLRLRSRILAQTRKMETDPKADQDMLRRLHTLADGVTDQLAQHSVEAVDARSFSRRLNDVFRRSFVGEILGRNQRGGNAIEPEMTLERTVGAGGPQAASRASAVERAVAMPEQGAAERVQAARQQVQSVIMDMASKAVNPRTGRIDPGALARFRANNKELLQDFPRANRLLSDTEASQRAIDAMIEQTGRSAKIAIQKSHFGNLVGVDEPATTFASALTSKSPASEIDGLFRFASRDAAAAAGARTAYIDAILAKSIKGNIISGKAMKDFIKSSNLIAAGEKTGVFSKEQSGALVKMADELEKIEAISADQLKLDKVLDSPDEFYDLFIRILGANVGAHGAIANTSGAGLVTAHYGSSSARKLLEKIPAGRIQDVLVEAIQNPALMRVLLTKPHTAKQGAKAIRQINGFLIQAGIVEPTKQEGK